jgi:hypothetical protein
VKTKRSPKPASIKTHLPASKQMVELKNKTPDPHNHTIIGELVPIPFEIDFHHPSPDHQTTEATPRWLRPFEKFRGDYASILSLLDLLTQRQASAWAILIVSFNDDPKPPTVLTKYEKVFMSAGAGTMNMLDYFEDMSHGKLDLSGSKVFGPFVLNRPRKITALSSAATTSSTSRRPPRRLRAWI